MAGCFGNSPYDRMLERQVIKHCSEDDEPVRKVHTNIVVLEGVVVYDPTFFPEDEKTVFRIVSDCEDYSMEYRCFGYGRVAKRLDRMQDGDTVLVTGKISGTGVDGLIEIRVLDAKSKRRKA